MRTMIMYEDESISDLDQLGFALAFIGRQARKPELIKQLGESFCAELTAAAVAFRQRLPEHWPGAQQDLPLLPPPQSPEKNA